MAIYGRQVGSLFLGTLRPSTRAYLQQFFARARERGYTRFVEPASGALAMSQLAAKAVKKDQDLKYFWQALELISADYLAGR